MNSCPIRIYGAALLANFAVLVTLSGVVPAIPSVDVQFNHRIGARRARRDDGGRPEGQGRDDADEELARALLGGRRGGGEAFFEERLGFVDHDAEIT